MIRYGAWSPCIFLMLFTADDALCRIRIDFLIMDRVSDTIPPDLFRPTSERLLPYNGRPIALLKSMAAVLQEGDKFLMVPLIAGG